jgi:ornithine cyclodeaminase
MKILQAESELRRLFSVAEQAAYLGDAWYAPGQSDMTMDEARMSFEAPARGDLVIKGGYKAGEKNFVIKFTTQFQPTAGTAPIQRKLTLVGDAHTGVITAMLPECNAKDHDKEARFLIPQLDWKEIQNCLRTSGDEHVWQLQKEGFKAFSAGDVTIPRVIYMPFNGRGDLHLKGAHKKGGDIYVFKIATGFPGNSDRGLLPTQGLMMAFDARTGTPLIVLRDEGHLTDLRTAIAGRNAAEELMPADDLTGIGVLGTGVQARLQIGLLKNLYPRCRRLTVWGHTPANTASYAREMIENGWEVSVVVTPRQVADAANLIITTTPSQVALLDADDITTPNSLIIAIGADMPGKIELSPALLKKADCVLIDSIVQGKDHGNAAGAIADKVIAESDLQEFGDFLNNGLEDSATANRLRLFLSSGIGVQDLQIVQAVIAGSRHSVAGALPPVLTNPNES